MTAVLPVILAALLVLAFGLIVRSAFLAFWSENQKAYIDEAEVRALRLEKTRAVESLRDLEFDLQLKKISQEDYDAMRGPAQRRALRAIQELDEALRQGVKLLAIGLFSMGMGVDALAAPGGNTLPQTTVVRARQVTPMGSVEPAAGIAVTLEAHVARMGPSNTTSVEGTASGVTDSSGVAKISWKTSPGADIQVRAKVGDREVQGVVSPTSPNTFDLLLEEEVRSTKDWKLEPRMILSIREGVIWVQGEWLLRHNSEGALRSPKGGLELPVISPIVGERSLDAQWFPPQAARHVKLGVTGSGSARFAEGKLLFDGTVGSGQTQQVRFEYPVDIVRHEMVLGIQSTDIEFERVMVALSSPRGERPGLRLEGSVVRGVEEERNGNRTLLQWRPHGAQPGELVLIRLRKLPHQGDFSRDALLALLFVGIIALGVGILRAQGRSGQFAEGTA